MARRLLNSQGFTSTTRRIRIVECLDNPDQVVSLRELLAAGLRCTPEDALAGLSQVLVRDVASITPRERLKPWYAKAQQGRTRGLYFASSKGHGAYIELFADNIASEWPSWAVRTPMLKDLIFLRVLYHELGHHVAVREVIPEHRHETAANRYSRRFLRRYFMRRYWLLAPLFLLADLAARISRRRPGTAGD